MNLLCTVRYLKSTEENSINDFMFQSDNTLKQENSNDFKNEEMKEKDNHLSIII